MDDKSVSEAERQPLDVSSVFGRPYTEGDKVLIPVAQITYGLGRGAFGGSARPVAVIEIGNGRVEIKTITEMRAVMLLGIVTGAWHVYWITRTIRELHRSRSR